MHVTVLEDFIDVAGHHMISYGALSKTVLSLFRLELSSQFLRIPNGACHSLKKKLIHTMNHTQFLCYGLLKTFLKGTRDNFKIHVNFMKPTFLCRLRQDETYDKK